MAEQYIRCIYKITSPSNKIYIGKTVNFKKRVRYYKYESCKKQKFLYNSIKKYGWTKHKIEILVQGNFNNKLLSELEINNIRLFNSYNSKHGMNLTKGGEGCDGLILSEETKDKLRVIMIERMKDQSLRDAHSIKMLEYYKNNTHPSLGKQRSLKTRDKMKNHWNINNASPCKEVIDTSTNQVFDSIKQAANHFNYTYKTLSNWLNGISPNKSTLKFITNG